MPYLFSVLYLPRPLRLLWRLTMPPYDDPNRPEFTGKRKPKNFARIYASCKGESLSDGKPNRECAKCGMVSKKKKCPGCGCTVFISIP